MIDLNFSTGTVYAGETRRITVKTFRVEGDKQTPVDPGTMSVTVDHEGGTSEVHTWPGDFERLSAGVFTCLHTFALPGTYTLIEVNVTNGFTKQNKRILKVQA